MMPVRAPEVGLPGMNRWNRFLFAIDVKKRKFWDWVGLLFLCSERDY